MAFIEPRLIHLLNDATTPQIGHTDLPPFAEGFPDPSDRPLPLEPTAGLQDEQLAIGHGPGSFAAHLSISGFVDDGLLPRDGKKDADLATDRGALGTGGTARIPLKMLLGESRLGNTSISSNRIPDESAQLAEEPGSKKRQRVLATKDEILHLPQPIKKQKAAPQPLLPSMPPIINGLHEPPPNAALFPPISSTEFGDAEQTDPRATIRDYQAPAGEDKAAAEVEPPKPQKSTGQKTRKKAMKPRRKWSEEETKHLLLGVNRHGVGKWTDILADEDFRFNNRTAGDLKDRFRTCCPNELRKNGGDGSSAGHETLPTPPAEPKTRARTGLLSENILIEDDYISVPGHARSGMTQSEGGNKKSRAHRKKLEDLAELGIHGPFKKSHRRERKPFSEQDDKQILEGLTKYGPAWTKIQRDSRFSLSGRQPTDLRDRVRNKYPEVYQKIEKGLFQVKDGKSNGTMEPTTQTSISNTLQSTLLSTVDVCLPRVGSREDLPRWPLPAMDAGDSSGQTFDLGPNASFLGATSEMDISRLLLDDNQVAHLPVRQFTGDAGADSVTL